MNVQTNLLIPLLSNMSAVYFVLVATVTHACVMCDVFYLLTARLLRSNILQPPCGMYIVFTIRKY